MKLYSAIRFILAAWLIAGIFLAPLSVSQPAQADPSAMMIHGMECCPKAPVHQTCPKCPLMAMCMTAFVLEQGSHFSIGGKTVVAVLNLIPSSEPLRTGLRSSPPVRPPRVLV